MRIRLLLLVSLASTAQADDPWSGVAETYRSWSRVGDQAPRLGPMDCPFYRDPPEEPHTRQSRAQRGEHERKAYFLYASDATRYRAITAGSAEPVEGLTVVKEAFRPTDLGPYRNNTPATRPLPDPRGEAALLHYRPRVIEGRLLGAGAPIGLFVMRFTRGRWEYATVHFDGRVEAAGQVEPCASCHANAPHHGLFGIHP